MFENTNLADYADPILYDVENSEFEPAGLTLLEMTRQVSGPVLDLGCGCGRMAIPLAQAGIEIVGLDVVPQMLAHGREKADDLPIRWVEADARAFHLHQKFELIFSTGAVFQHLLSLPDQEACLARVREHLTDNGRFVFDLGFPNLQWLTNVAEEEEWFTYTTPDERNVRVSGVQVYDPIRQVKTETAVRRWTDANGSEITRMAPLSLRFYYPQEIAALLHYNGFCIVDTYGDWDLTPLTAQSTMMIQVCEVTKHGISSKPGVSRPK